MIDRQQSFLFKTLIATKSNFTVTTLSCIYKSNSGLNQVACTSTILAFADMDLQLREYHVLITGANGDIGTNHSAHTHLFFLTNSSF